MSLVGIGFPARGRSGPMRPKLLAVVQETGSRVTTGSARNAWRSSKFFCHRVPVRKPKSSSPTTTIEKAISSESRTKEITSLGVRV